MSDATQDDFPSTPAHQPTPRDDLRARREELVAFLRQAAHPGCAFCAAFAAAANLLDLLAGDVEQLWREHDEARNEKDLLCAELTSAIHPEWTIVGSGWQLREAVQDLLAEAAEARALPEGTTPEVVREAMAFARIRAATQMPLQISANFSRIGDIAEGGYCAYRPTVAAQLEVLAEWAEAHVPVSETAPEAPASAVPAHNRDCAPPHSPSPVQGCKHYDMEARSCRLDHHGDTGSECRYWEPAPQPTFPMQEPTYPVSVIEPVQRQCAEPHHRMTPGVHGCRHYNNEKPHTWPDSCPMKLRGPGGRCPDWWPADETPEEFAARVVEALEAERAVESDGAWAHDQRAFTQRSHLHVGQWGCAMGNVWYYGRWPEDAISAARRADIERRLRGEDGGQDE
jgi:hypothetical protein